METLKTAAVVVLLLAVLYGVYVVLNRPGDLGMPEVGMSSSEEELATDLDIEIPEVAMGEFPGLPDSAEKMIPQSAGSTTTFNEDADVNNGIQPPPEGNTGFDPGVDVSAAPSDPSIPPAESGGTFSPTGDSAYNPAPPAPATPQNFGIANFERDWEDAYRQIENQRYREGLEQLTIYYRSADLSSSQHDRLLDMLDALAGKVIYSTDHLAGESPYTTRGESLREVARSFSVPWQLLANINGIRDPDTVVPGTTLKVVRGPFRGEVSLARRELTLFVGRMYAGRFDLSLGDEPAPVGSYSVSKQSTGETARAYYSADGRVNIPAGDPRNPYGEYFLSLGREVSIHGSPLRGDSEGRGCISLAPRDAADVYGILSHGSAVMIRR